MSEFSYMNYCTKLIDEMRDVADDVTLSEFDRALEITKLADDLVDSAASWQDQAKVEES